MLPARALPALLVLSLLGGCGAAGPPGGPSPATSPAPPASAASTPSASDAAFEALFHARADSALALYSEADARFVRGMISHHAQAVAMADAAETRAASPEIRTLAARIAAGQTDEIDLMERWLEDRGEPLGEHTFHPGMLTPEQMDLLLGSRGEDFDRTFLELMIVHHQGALAMVEELLAAGGATADDTVFRFASNIQADQRTEIARMRRMLAERSTAGR